MLLGVFASLMKSCWTFDPSRFARPIVVPLGQLVLAQ